MYDILNEIKNEENNKQRGGEGLAPRARSCAITAHPRRWQYVNLFAIKFDISLANIEYRVLNIR